MREKTCGPNIYGNYHFSIQVEQTDLYLSLQPEFTLSLKLIIEGRNWLTWHLSPSSEEKLQNEIPWMTTLLSMDTQIFRRILPWRGLQTLDLPDLARIH